MNRAHIMNMKNSNNNSLAIPTYQPTVDYGGGVGFPAATRPKRVKKAKKKKNDPSNKQPTTTTSVKPPEAPKYANVPLESGAVAELVTQIFIFSTK